MNGIAGIIGRMVLIALATVVVVLAGWSAVS